MTTIKAIAFDLYGTLVDVHSVAARCEALWPGRGAEVSAAWRAKLLEYTWLRSLMGRYASFEQVGDDALVAVCRRLALPLEPAQRSALNEAALRPTPFPEVPAALRRLRERGLPLAVLSNGSVRSIDAVIGHTGLRELFTELISVEAAQVFKPHPRVYALAEGRLALPREQILFVSSNAWDASGARSFGFPVCWIDRGGGGFEELGEQPNHVVRGLDALAEWIEAGAH